jgi:hypothetical protein
MTRPHLPSEARGKTVGIWIRVSTEDQAKGESPEHHEHRARMYAESKDWLPPRRRQRQGDPRASRDAAHHGRCRGRPHQRPHLLQTRPPRPQHARPPRFRRLLEASRSTPGWRGTQALRRVWSANHTWDRTHGPADPAVYRTEIWPGLRGRPLRELVAATGMSKTTCSQIRQGRKIPHPRHWEALELLILQAR